MHPDHEINLVAEILPVSLLKCKHALDAMTPHDLLCVRTDDRIVVEHMIKLIRNKEYRIVRQDNTGKRYTIYILKESIRLL